MARFFSESRVGSPPTRRAKLCRLLVRAGHDVPVTDTGCRAVRDRAHLRGARPSRGAEGPLSAPRRCGPARHRAALGEHARQAGAWARRQCPHPARARLPRARPRGPGHERRMWEHPATQANAAALAERGVELLGPAGGSPRASTGPAAWWSRKSSSRAARAPRPDRPARRQARRRLRGRHPGAHRPRAIHRQPVVGADGVAVAAEAKRRGAVTLVYANGVAQTPAGVEVVPAPTAADLGREMLARADADVVVMAAAVSDPYPESGKRPKDREPWTITLEPTDDVLAELGRRKHNGQILVGFAAEGGEDGLERAPRQAPTRTGTFSSTTTYLNPVSGSSPRTTKSSSSRHSANGS